MSKGEAIPTPALRPRHAEATLRRALTEARVVVLNGPRQAGKTTLSRVVFSGSGGHWVSLDSDAALHACVSDPIGFLAAYPRPLFIDEFQRAGDALVRAIKLAVDEDPARGQFLLSGSSRFLTIRTISESLAGRAQLVDLWPYLQGEADRLDQGSDQLLYRLFDPGFAIGASEFEPVSRSGFVERLCRGGYPEANEMDPGARRRWFSSYVSTITQRDVPEVGRGAHLQDIPKLLRILAARTAQELVVDRLASDSGIDRFVLARNYLPLLETVYLTTSLPAWSRNYTSRAIKHPKIYISDPGLAAGLLGVSEEALLRPGSPVLGPLVETFAATELVRQASRGLEPALTLHHFRSRGQSEIDVVAEAADGRIVAIEVKATHSPDAKMFKALADLRDRTDQAGGSFVRGVVLHLGEEMLPFGDRLLALPFSSLWQTQ